MSRFGLCAFCFQPEQMWQAPRHPHEKPEMVAVEGLAFCKLLECFDMPPPPPIERHMGCFQIEHGDCDRCPHFVPAGIEPLEKFARNRKRRVNRQRAKAKAAAKSCGQ